MGAMKRFTCPDGKAEIVATQGILNCESTLFVDSEPRSSRSEVLSVLEGTSMVVSHGEYSVRVTFRRGSEPSCDWDKYPGKRPEVKMMLDSRWQRPSGPRCPKCGFSYAYNGVTCGHCGYPRR